MPKPELPKLEEEKEVKMGEEEATPPDMLTFYESQRQAR